MIEGQPWRGAEGNAGEIGHMIVTPDGRPCPCGNHGCLERYVSLAALEEQLGRELEASDLAALADRWPALADPLDTFIEAAAPRPAQAVGILEVAFDPETVILGGLVPTPLLQRLISVARLPVSVGARAERRWPRILIGQGGSEAVLLGAAALPIFDSISLVSTFS